MDPGVLGTKCCVKIGVFLTKLTKSLLCDNNGCVLEAYGPDVEKINEVE